MQANRIQASRARARFSRGFALALLLTSAAAQAGPLTVTNTFSNDAVADADDVNQNFTDVETAVTDNDGRITSNTAATAANTTRSTTNATAIGVNTGAISVNAQAIADNAQAISDITLDAADKAEIQVNQLDIERNSGRITTLETSVGQLTGIEEIQDLTSIVQRVTTVEGQLNTPTTGLVDSVATNTSTITANRNDLQGQIDTNATAITGINDRLAAGDGLAQVETNRLEIEDINTTKIPSLDTRVGANETDVAEINDRLGDPVSGSGIDARLLDIEIIVGRLFGGDGSFGPYTAQAGGDFDWNDTTDFPANPMFTDFTIQAGATLVVPAGTTIRCTGDFLNEGTLIVDTGAAATATSFSVASSFSSPSGGPSGAAHPGDAFGAAGIGEATSVERSVTYVAGVDVYNGTVLSASVGGIVQTVVTPIIVPTTTDTAHGILAGGRGGVGIPRPTAATAFKSFRIGGGAGATSESAGVRNGGGLLKVYCNGNITNSGEIRANGADGSIGGGGGGGGVVVLAARGAVQNAVTGVINANGGSGANGTSRTGNNGGGGGGVVVMVSRTAPQDIGTISVSGGAAGSGTSTQASNFGRRAGSGGGASGGNGGNGGDNPADRINDPATAGSDGYLLQLTQDPLYLLF